ncbi:serine hydrolase domain-containing protein [Rhizobium sp. C4]|uniref:serine hydrolase domain-containing protein n=1 Tax=Rhizobium sp. C4 TaxID=1349800 RepID=UPI001E345A51|nr:serine hydrolase domain-containing protein [Rhizobium sp. C4]MCD2175885.1 beta-lactamase family protein [Rhizobium sp. C4]
MSMQDRLDRVIDTAVARKTIVGCVVIVRKNGKEIYSRAAGYADREAERRTREDTIFRFASVTKPFVAAATLAMIDQGKLGLDDRAVDHLPWFHPKGPNGEQAQITIRHLLTHTSGLTYDPTLEERAPESRVTIGILDTDRDAETNFRPLNNIPLAFEPGTAWAYSVGLDILGALIARVHGGTLEEVVNHYVTGPLGLKDSSFHVTDRERLAAAYADGAKGAIRMPNPYYPPRESGWTAGFSPDRIFNEKAFQSGGAGMAGTAQEVMTLLDTLARGGGKVLSPKLAEAGFSNQVGDITCEPGMRFGFFGSVCEDPGMALATMAKGAVQWGGVYGNTWLVDLDAGITMVSLSNTALEGCMGAFPDNLRRAVYGV